MHRPGGTRSTRSLAHHHRAFLPLALLWLAAACSDESKLPDGVECRSKIDGGSDGGSLAAALGIAAAGDCVVIGASVYQGSFEVPAGVKLVAARGTGPEIKGTRSDKPALHLLGGEGALLQGITIVSAPGVGILLDGNQVELVDAAVRAAKFGLVAYCAGSGCLGKAMLTGLVLIGNDTGLLVSGAALHLSGGKIAENGISQSLHSGVGIAAENGATLEMVGTVVEKNDYGVIIDGASSTTARLTDVQVLSSVERGIWLQHIRGTRAEPGVIIEGSKTLIDGNALSGVGAVDSRGIAIRGAKIANTLARPLLTKDGQITVGDGLGLFSGTGAVTVDDVRFESNARCQVLIDQGGEGIDLTRLQVTLGKGQWNVVVQNTSLEVNLDSRLDSSSYLAGAPLPVSAPALELPQPPGR